MPNKKEYEYILKVSYKFEFILLGINVSIISHGTLQWVGKVQLIKIFALHCNTLIIMNAFDYIFQYFGLHRSFI